MSVLDATLDVALSAAPWLVLGLVLAGLIRAFVPERVVQRWIGGGGFGSVARAAVAGVPLPLCSCGAIPTAMALHRGGAGRGPTTAFLVSTPGVGADSLALTYALLGPFMTAARALGAVVTAVATGLLVGARGRHADRAAGPSAPNDCGTCCGSAHPSHGASASPAGPPTRRLRQGLAYAFGTLWADLVGWVALGLLLAGMLFAVVPPQALAGVGGGVLALVLMAVVGIPLYVCAAAATPVAAGMLVAGVSPGAVLVFLLAGPITSLATLGALRQEMGTRALVRYLTGVLGTTVLLGAVVDAVLGRAAVDVVAQASAVREVMPAWLEWAGLAVLVLVSAPAVRRALGRLRRPRVAVGA